MNFQILKECQLENVNLHKKKNKFLSNLQQPHDSSNIFT